MEGKYIKVNIGDGFYLFKLKQLLAEKNMTRYYLSKHSFIEYRVITNYVNGNIKKIDMNVVSKICNYFNCKMSDIIEYIPFSS